MATTAMSQESSSPRLFNNFFDDEDFSHFCLMAKGSKVQESTTSSSLISSSSTPSDIDDLDGEKEIEYNMVKQFSKKGYKEIKRFLEKLEKNEVSLLEQEDFLILEKERNLALERSLAKEAAKVEKLTTDLSLANNSNKRMSKDYTLANESLASLKATERHGYPWVPTGQGPRGPCQVDPTCQKPHQPTSGPGNLIHDPDDLGRPRATSFRSRKTR
jgi:hypothetical protein